MNVENLPEKVQRRIGLSGLFYPMDRNVERRWGRAMQAGFERIASKLQDEADELNYNQENPEENVIIWRDDSDSVECMFYLIEDVMDIDQVSMVYDLIRKYDAFFTYAFVWQKKDGEHCYDIFRLSKFSYLEHCNRVYGVKK